MSVVGDPMTETEEGLLVLAGTAAHWADELTPYSPEDIGKAITHLNRQRDNLTWPPSLGQMVAVCREYKQARLMIGRSLLRHNRPPVKPAPMPESFRKLMRGMEG